ncbi:hypothetical protein GA0115255_112151, partial [Streptomyces sp. Ncost-T6T-2b]
MPSWRVARRSAAALREPSESAAAAVAASAVDTSP